MKKIVIFNYCHKECETINLKDRDRIRIIEEEDYKKVLIDNTKGFFYFTREIIVRSS